MRARLLSRPQPWILAVLVLLLALLAALQYRWIGQVSRLERQRMAAVLHDSGTRFAEDFDREVTRAFLYFHPDPADEVRGRTVRQAERWQAEAPYPELVRDVFLVERDEDGELSLEVLIPGDPKPGFRPAAWPADLQGLRREIVEESVPNHPLRVVAPDLPGLAIPSNWPARLHRGLAMSSGDSPPDREYLILRFDRKVLAEEIFPALTRRHFGGRRGLEFAVAVVSASDPNRLIFRSDPKITAEAFRSSDVEMGMFGLRPFDELRSFWRGRGLWNRRRNGTWGEAPSGAPPAARQEDRHERIAERIHGVLRHGDHNAPERGEAPWRLVVKHRDGSLEQAVAHVRRHNLAVGAGILALLGVTGVLMVVSTQRAQTLARQQIDFVAGVSHELRTPITAIRSAGQNLADGVVSDPAQVRRYGTLIASEGRRLSQRVEQVLEFASLRSDRKPDLHPTRIEDVLDAALDDCRWLLEERQAEVEEDVPAGLPAVLGDAAGLRRAVRNLIENAAKYGGPAPWIGLRARAAGREVEVTVEDRGPGILSEDLPHLFEPFYRGWRGRGGEVGVPGSGLGLSIVRHVADAHSGRVTVSPGSHGQGSAFTLHIPVAPPQAAPGRAALGEASSQTS